MRMCLKDKVVGMIYSEYQIEEIRFLPMSNKVFDTPDKVYDFLFGGMDKQGGYYYYTSKAMQCDLNTLVLFQYGGKLIASAILIDQGKDIFIDKFGNKCNGYYRFDADSIIRFEEYISVDDFKNIDNTFKGFNQGARKTGIHFLPQVLDLIEIKMKKDNIVNEHKAFWGDFVKSFEIESELSNEFNKRKISEKDYYDLFWDSRGVHICVRHNCIKQCVVVEAYIEEDKELFVKLKSWKDDICKEYGSSLVFEPVRETKGKEGKASKIYISKDFDFSSRDYYKGAISWIIDNSLKMKKIIQEWRNKPIYVGDSKNVISFPVGGTYKLVDKYLIHSHPVKRGFPSNVTQYIAARQTGGYMDAVYKVIETIDLLPKDVDWTTVNIIDERKDRLKNYLDNRMLSYGFENDGVPYRFYILELYKNIDPVMQLVPNPRSYIYYDLNDLINNVETEPLETVVYGGKEGTQKQYYVTKYERDPANRKEAMRIHGFSCQVCGFNFEEVYGTLGKEFIEVHHSKPLYSLEEETVINPETDLVCLCANCHRMLHRKRNEILSVEELKQLYKKE